MTPGPWLERRQKTCPDVGIFLSSRFPQLTLAIYIVELAAIVTPLCARPSSIVLPVWQVYVHVPLKTPRSLRSHSESPQQWRSNWHPSPSDRQGVHVPNCRKNGRHDICGNGSQITGKSTARSTRPINSGQDGRRSTDGIFRCIFLNKKFCILIKISLKFVPMVPINNNPAMV